MLNLNHLTGFNVGGSWVTVFDQTANVTSDFTGQANGSIRNIVPTISTGGSRIRCTFVAHSSFISSFNNVAVGIRSGATDDCTAIPTEIKTGGVSGISIAAGGTKVTDETPFTCSAGDSLLVVGDFGASTDNGKYSAVDPGGGINSYRQTSAATYNTQNMTGTLNGGAVFTWSLTKVEVFTG